MLRKQKVTIRLNDIENNVVRERASRNQITVSEYIRNLILIKELESSPEMHGGTTTPPCNQ